MMPMFCATITMIPGSFDNVMRILVLAINRMVNEDIRTKKALKQRFRKLMATLRRS